MTTSCSLFLILPVLSIFGAMNTNVTDNFETYVSLFLLVLFVSTRKADYLVDTRIKVRGATSTKYMGGRTVRTHIKKLNREKFCIENVND